MVKSKHKHGEPGLITRREQVGRKLNAKELAKEFHELYERLAPDYGYETRKDTRKFDENSSNGKLMIAVCQELIDEGLI